MNDQHLLAIDAGTGSCRAVLFDAALRQVGVALREWVHPRPPDVPGGYDFDVTTNWQLIAECIRDVLHASGVDASSVVAVCPTSMREGIVLYDTDGRELWACPNIDGRAGRQAESLVDQKYAQRIYEVAGDWVSITSPPRIMWLQEHRPELLDRVAGLSLLSDWIVYRLSGELVTEPSCGSSSGMFDLATRGWSEEVAEISGASNEWLPPVVESGTVVGRVTETAAAQTGLAAGTAVVAGGGDTQLALLGLGTRTGEFTVIGGTFWQSTLLVDTPLIDPGVRLRTLCHVVPDRWMIEGIGFLCGLSMRWLRDAMFDQTDAGDRDLYEAMDDRAGQVPPGANGVVAILSNVMNAQSWRHASPSFLQFDLNDPVGTGRSACVRAVEEAAAYVARAHRDILEEVSGRRIESAVFSGGAAKGNTWTQIMASVLDRPVEVPTVTESSARGAAFCAGLGIGLFSRTDATRLRARSRCVSPDPRAAEVYDRTFEEWKSIYRAQLSISDGGQLRSLWTAAGATSETIDICSAAGVKNR
jgi:autoinducer-2 kinase